jgi:hypothetical protein
MLQRDTPMLKIRQSIFFAIIALNITAFALMLQLDLLTFNSTTAKIIAWLTTIAAWRVTYMRRNKYYTLQ